MAKRTSRKEAPQEQPASPGAVGVTVNQGLPDVTIIVNEGTTIKHEGETYEGGSEVTMSGATAISLVANGYATAKEEES